jgi:Transmembrane amino acid transporter protein
MSISFSFFLCLLFALGGYLSFGEYVQGDFLNNFPYDNAPASTARVLLAGTMLFTYPMECFVARHCLLAILSKYRQNRARGGLLLSMSMSTHSSSGGSGSKHAGSQKSLLHASTHSEGGDERIGGAGDTIASHETSIQDDQETADEDYVEVTLFESRDDGDVAGARSSPRRDDSEPNQVIPIVEHSSRERVLVTLVLWGTSLGLAMASKSLEVVLALTGALAASMLGRSSYCTIHGTPSRFVYLSWSARCHLILLCIPLIRALLCISVRLCYPRAAVRTVQSIGVRRGVRCISLQQFKLQTKANAEDTDDASLLLFNIHDTVWHHVPHCGGYHCGLQCDHRQMN